MTLKNLLKQLTRYTFFWLVFFIFIRIVFLIFHYQNSFLLPASEWIYIFCYGYIHDVITTCCIVLISLFLLVLNSITKKIFFFNLITIWSFLVIIIVSIIAAADLLLYKYWEFKIELSALLYLNTPADIFKSLTSVEIYTAILIGVSLISIGLVLYKNYFIIKTNPNNKNKITLLLLFLLNMIIVFIGFKYIDVGTVYFSKNTFSNHAAINNLWSITYSIKRQYFQKNPYTFMSHDEAKKLLLLKNTTTTLSISSKLINTTTPNILLIILEGFTSNIVEPLGGLRGITPKLNKYCSEGILFRNMYAAGGRTDKALSAIFCGFPALPVKSALFYPKKIEHLPYLTHHFQNIGYTTAFYYGGDIAFTIFKPFVLAAKFDAVINKYHFNPSVNYTKWGIPDGIMLDKLFTDLSNIANPFFYTILTLSSHEPFDVPIKTKFYADNEIAKFLNAAYYTDSCLGNFIDKAKHSKWWNTTLIIIVADHGRKQPGNFDYYAPEKFSIPMLWLGGALNISDTVIYTYGTQFDIPATILEQLNCESTSFIFSTSILENPNNTAFYAFNNGFGYLSKNFKLVYDCNENKYRIKWGNYSDYDLLYGKAFLQNYYQFFIDN